MICVSGVSELSSQHIFAAAGHDGLGRFGAHAPEQHLDQMHAPVGHQAAGVIPEPAEVEVEPVRVEGRCGAGPSQRS